MSQQEKTEQIKAAAKLLKKEYEDDLSLNRAHGNYKYEITPGDIYKAVLYGAEIAAALQNSESANVQKSPQIQVVSQ
jgi:hypothetical protein